jgi:uncharacterized RDD family membrane protein YckC
LSGGLGGIFDNPKRKDHWIKRGVAYIIDSIIITVVYVIIVMIGTMIFIGSVIGGAMSGDPIGGTFGGLLILFLFIIIAMFFSIAYWIYFDAKGGTPGKKFMKLKPISLVGEMTYTKAAIRNGSKIVGGFIGGMIEGAVGIMLIGFLIELIIVILDTYMGITSGKDPRQKYTDTMADTTVVRTDLEEDVEGMRFIPALPVPTTTNAPVQEPGLRAAGTTKNENTDDDSKEPPQELPLKEPAKEDESAKDLEKKLEEQNEIIQKYIEFFEITEERAQVLYDSGYKRLADFKDAIAEDLVMVEKINPTIARNIVKKMDNY